MYKRLQAVCSSRCTSELLDVLASLGPVAARLTPDERASTPSPSLNAGIDLSTAQYFLSKEAHFLTIVSVLQKHDMTHLVQYSHNRNLQFHVVVKFLLMAFFGIANTWKLRTILSPAEITLYKANVNTFSHCWTALAWKPTPWVHWLCAHSSFFVDLHLNIGSFSSLPTERRHQQFKLDLRHAFQGWKVASPITASRYLRTVVQQDSLDLALSLPKRKRARR